MRLSRAYKKLEALGYTAQDTQYIDGKVVRHIIFCTEATHFWFESDSAMYKEIKLARVILADPFTGEYALSAEYNNPELRTLRDDPFIVAMPKTDLQAFTALMGALQRQYKWKRRKWIKSFAKLN